MHDKRQIDDARPDSSPAPRPNPSIWSVRGYRQVFLGLALLLLMIGFVIPLPNEYRAVWFSRLQDTLHAPAFALVAVCLRLLFARSLFQTLALGCGLAVLVEVVQAGVGRSISLMDLAYDGCGLAAAFVFLRALQTHDRFLVKFCHVIVAVILVLIPLVQESPVFIDAWQAARDFPVLADFRSSGELQRWYRSGVTLRRILVDGKWRGEVFNRSLTTYGSVILLPVVGDWSAYRRVCCEFSFSGPALQILISARDANGRIDIVREYSAGTHHVCLNLRDPVTTGHLSHLDLIRVQSFHFALCDSPNRTALIHDVRLD